MSGSDDLLVSGYDAVYTAWGQSPTLRRIWQDHVTGADFPDDFAHISFVSGATLRAIAQGLEVDASSVVVDLACGAGGPGLWVARETGARLIGRDLSPIGVARASERAAALGMDGVAAFAVGRFDQTGVASDAADGVMTVDALQYASDKATAMAEIARILRPGGRFVFVAFELDGARIAGVPGVWSDPVGDYRPLLRAAGLEVTRYDQLPGWRDQVAGAFGAIVAHHATLAAELGSDAADAIALEAAVTLELEPYCGHVLGVAVRT
jgi:SAM-dependent methyltransferase